MTDDRCSDSCPFVRGCETCPYAGGTAPEPDKEDDT